MPSGITGIKKEEYRRIDVYKRQGMEIVHKVIVGIQISVDERHTVGGTGHHIQPPVGFWVLVGFHL